MATGNSDHREYILYTTWYSTTLPLVGWGGLERGAFVSGGCSGERVRSGDFVKLVNNLHALYMHMVACAQTMFGHVWQQRGLRHHMTISHGACDSGRLRHYPTTGGRLELSSARLSSHRHFVPVQHFKHI